MNKPLNPYADLNGCRIYRASLHNHTFKKRPTISPVAALSLYRMLDIPILALTDHDRRIPRFPTDAPLAAPGMVPKRRL